MNEQWNLDPIYKGFSDPEFSGDIQALERAAAGFNEFVGTLGQKTALSGLQLGIAYLEEITQVAMKLATYAELCQSTNTRNSEAGSRFGQIMQILSTTAGAEAAWKQWAAELPDLAQLVAEDPQMTECDTRPNKNSSGGWMLCANHFSCIHHRTLRRRHMSDKLRQMFRNEIDIRRTA